ncbi:MAG TPA: protoporphyrinogen oxidase [Acidimicrobiales bacterium]|nr:protoporphyrinogen oxidase [Acidimicrobiales bacterium]
MSQSSVVIVGGGISGLAAAWELTGGEAGPTHATPRVEVIEASERCGGSLATTTFAGRTIDLGADGFLARRPEAVELALELGLEAEMEPIAESGAWLYVKGSLHELPPGLVLGVPTSLETVRRFKGLGWRARVGAARDAFVPARLDVSEDVSIGDITRTKLGRELSYRFIEPMIGGIQAGRIDDLSAKSVFPALYAAARTGGSLMRALRPTTSTPASELPLFYSLVEGVGSLPQQLMRQLSERGVVIRTNVAVTAVRRTPAASYPLEVDTPSTTTPANGLILATPAPVTAGLIGSFEPELNALRGIDSASAAIITFSIPRDAVSLPPRGTGVLVPLHTPWSGQGPLMVTALTFLDRKWPHLYRSDDVLLRAHVGRSDDTRWRDLSDDELVQRLNDELRVLLSKWGAPRETLVQRWLDGLPQYRVGHEQLVEHARLAAGKYHVFLAGNAYDGVGVPASVGSGRRAARELVSL